MKNFDNNVPGLYDNSTVAQIDGDQGVQILTNKSHEKNLVVAAYHPQCPHCTHMVQDYKILADEVKDKKLDLEVVAINMSKTDFEAAGIEGVPVIRLYKKDGSMVEMKK